MMLPNNKFNARCEDISYNVVVGWVEGLSANVALDIEAYNGNLLIAYERIKQKDIEFILKESPSTKRLKFQIQLPRGFKTHSSLRLLINGNIVSFSNRLINKIELVRRNFSIETNDGYFFIHVPKTAGTSFIKLIENGLFMCERSPSKDEIRSNNGKYPKLGDLIKLDPIESESPVLLAGHYPFITKEVFVNVPKVMVFLRNPLERVISNIFHMKNYNPKMKNLTPSEIYYADRWHYINLQTRYLCDTALTVNARFISRVNLGQPELKLAIKNLEQCDFIGIVEDFKNSIKNFNKKFGMDLSSDLKVNQAKSPKQIDEELKKQIISDNTLDFELYKIAKELTNKNK